MNLDEREFEFRSEEARTYATMGLTGLYIVHGGAATAIIASFSEEVLASGIKSLPVGVIIALASYAVGISLTLATTLFGYFAAMGRAPIENDKGWFSRIPPGRADMLTGAAEICGVIALLLFVVGGVAFFFGLW